MIRIEHCTITYEDTLTPTLDDVNLVIPEGELVLVTGRTGSGKSTLLGMINGLVPHFTGGLLRGSVRVDGLTTAKYPPRDLAHVVGVVSQDPLAGFVTDTVEEELAYAMEQLAIPGDVMRKRVEETLDLMGIAELRGRALSTLSGGQQQRVAIGAALTSHPKVLVLDEPTSSLDPTAAEEVLSAFTRLVHDLGMTVIIAEHRLERIVQYVDHMLYLPGDGSVVSGPPEEILRVSDLAPPIAHLGRALNWERVPLSVRDARRLAHNLRDQLLAGSPSVEDVTAPRGDRTDVVATVKDLDQPAHQPPALTAKHITVRYPATIAVRGVDVALYSGEVVALMGRNGSGKSSLLWALQGSGQRQGGSVEVTTLPQRGTKVTRDVDAANDRLTYRALDQTSVDPAQLSPSQARRFVGLVPQTPTDLLYLSTVAAECAQADQDAGQPAGTCRTLLGRITPGIQDMSHPRDLSEGQKLSLVLAIQLTAEPHVILLDEPTRGLDYHAKASLTHVLCDLAKQGHSIVVATHDVEFVATTADRVIVMADGEIIADGDTRSVVAASPAFAPQVAKALAPIDAMTVDDVLLRLKDLKGTSQ